MQVETVEFKMDVSDENIKREVMKIVWMFSVTFVDIKEKGILKVKGKYDKIQMGSKLHELDNSVDIINQMGKTGQYRIPSLTSVYSYFTTPNIQEVVVFKFKVLDEKMKRDAMEVIWEFSGITSVEVKRDNQLEVKGGEFNKIAMSTKLKEIDESVSVIIKYGPDGQVDVTNIKINNARKTSRVPAPVPVRAPAPTPKPAPAPPSVPASVAAYANMRLYVHKTPIWKKCFRAISCGLYR
ncbi:unnamed protein product [Arabidopsis thaliana]|uniref:Uncharacterized protein n=1 Tax=Arabidopsis thaliana TaxID=3702 RepID=A0A5S9YEJ9_ARATH|nr:unnamed protein product [Arabidopsis thaliana]